MMDKKNNQKDGRKDHWVERERGEQLRGESYETKKGKEEN